MEKITLSEQIEFCKINREYAQGIIDNEEISNPEEVTKVNRDIMVWRAIEENLIALRLMEMKGAKTSAPNPGNVIEEIGEDLEGKEVSNG